MTVEAERGEMHPKAKDPGGHWRLEDTGRLFLEPPEGCGSKDTLSVHSWTPGL